MSVVTLYAASTDEPVSLIEAKAWLRLPETETGEDSLVEGLIVMARQRWEARTNRSALVQTFDQYEETAPTDDCPIPLLKAPVVSVSSIRGFSLDEATDTGGTAMSTSGYYVDTAHEFGTVTPLSGFTFPTATRTINPVIIRFDAGYSTSTTGVPDDVKVEIKELVAALYEHRGDEAEMQAVLANFERVTAQDLPTWG